MVTHFSANHFSTRCA